MDDLISRQAAIRIASGYCHPANIAEELAKLPAAQPERKTGKWMPTGKEAIFGADVRCSVCGESFSTTELTKEIYCRHCGAYMGGDEE